MSIKDETRYQYNLTLRRDTRRNWRLKNPVLLSGEIGIEYEDITVSDGEETAEFPTASNNQKMVSFKVGNGVDEWNNLPYASGEQGVAGEQGDPLRVDELDTIDRRYLFDDKNKGFSFLAIDEGKIYFKLTNGIGDWTEGFPFGQGIKGEKGEKGTSIESVEFTSTTHESGLPHQLDAIDTYTIIFDNGITEDFKIQNGTSTVWSADGTPYPVNAQVYHNGKQWLALRANSVEPTEGEDWTELVGKQYVDANLPDFSGYLQPSVTGSATLNGTTDNTIQLTDIVTALELEVGDVIRIQYSGYDKLHTVESITDDNSIIVNYEHAGNRGNGSLKLPDTTASATVTRIAKWYNAPLGLGQAWVDVSGSRVSGVDYTNLNSRDIYHYIPFYINSTKAITYRLGGISFNMAVDSGYGGMASISNPVPSGSSYGVTLTGASIRGWVELR